MHLEMFLNKIMYTTFISMEFCSKKILEDRTRGHMGHLYFIRFGRNILWMQYIMFLPVKCAATLVRCGALRFNR